MEKMELDLDLRRWSIFLYDNAWRGREATRVSIEQKNRKLDLQLNSLESYPTGMVEDGE